MILTNRDENVFRKLQSYGLLRTSQLATLVFPNVNLATVLRRLRKLEADGYIQRVMRLEGYELTWTVTLKGAQKVGGGAIKRNIRSDTIDHELKLIELRLKLEGCGIAQSWVPEHVIRSNVASKHGLRRIKERIIPDGLMGVTTEKSQESISIELELNFKNSVRYSRLFREYRWKESLWGVWYLVSSPGLGRFIEREWHSCADFEKRILFMWSLADDVAKDPLNAKVYMRKKIYAVKDLWTPKFPAQPPAPRVSGLQGQGALARLISTIENNEEKLAPAS